MPTPTPTARPMPAPDRVRETKLGLLMVAATVVGLLVVAVVGGDAGEGSASGTDGGADAAAFRSADADVPDADDELADLVGMQADEEIEFVDLVEPEPGDVGDDCRLEGSSVRMGDSGHDVTCLQQALAGAGAYSGPPSGEFDRATFQAVSDAQTERSLFVDGVVGRETALSLDIWPDEESFVIRTPPPAPGAIDSLGFPLSSVATTGADAPSLPGGSGSGRRLVYERQGQRVWAVGENGEIIRSWLVTGSMYSNEMAGTHYVYSRSVESTAWNGAARLPKMVRWLQTERGHIGFHGIPTRMDNGEPYQTDAELGTRLSGGCQRQADLDADFVWEFAPEGTKVVVL
ncbi:hypothetical protein BH23ACT3_BH23ACT3_08810 [soil metagenome]